MANEVHAKAKHKFQWMSRSECICLHQEVNMLQIELQFISVYDFSLQMFHMFF